MSPRSHVPAPTEGHKKSMVVGKYGKTAAGELGDDWLSCLPPCKQRPCGVTGEGGEQGKAAGGGGGGSHGESVVHYRTVLALIPGGAELWSLTGRIMVDGGGGVVL